MSNETKRDVFERALTEWYDLIFEVGGQGNEAYGYCEFDVTLSKYEKDYDAALPDNLPVIPRAVGEYIKWGKKYDIQLYMMYYSQLIHRPGFKKLTDDDKSWIISSSNIFTRAWVLGIWRVEETGEIVKLEAEK